MDIKEIQTFLNEVLSAHTPFIKIRKETDSLSEYAGTIEAMQGKQKVDGYYFSSVVLKPKDVRLYFFPIYTHEGEFKKFLSPELAKQLKGKSCFHIKKLDDNLKGEIKAMIAKAVKIYQKEGLIANS